MSYKRMKAFDKDKNFVGYLSCVPDFTTQQAMVADADEAYKYQFVTFEGRDDLRLDQQTDGGDRSLTYSSLGVYPCWGLGVNWVYVNHETTGRISFKYGDERRYLGRGLFNHGPSWTRTLNWLHETDNDGKTWQILSFEFDEDEQA
jgi:hypothetical protein